MYSCAIGGNVELLHGFQARDVPFGVVVGAFPVVVSKLAHLDRRVVSYESTGVYKRGMICLAICASCVSV